MKAFEVTYYVNVAYKCIVHAENEDEADEIAENEDIDEWDIVYSSLDFSEIIETNINNKRFPIFKD